MKELTPNEKQKEVIQNTEGIYLVDAGAGTGKTFTITKRYIYLLEERSVSPEDLLLITFTNNAADQMKEKVINESEYSASRLNEAPICTFHSYANKLVSNYGLEVPGLLGIEEELSSTCRIIEGGYDEVDLFDRFFRSFRFTHGEYKNLFRANRDPKNLLSLLKSLAAKGILPEKEGWYRGGKDTLAGDFSGFWELVEELNSTRKGKNGPKQSLLRKRLRNLLSGGGLARDAPTAEELGVTKGSKTVNQDWLRRAFREDRDRLFGFIHDLYWGYLRNCLSKNYLNFGFWMALSYLLLCERDRVRNGVGARYVMIDEFQDTNEVQLKMAMLLAEEGNLCVVGDWKQSIFGFRFADVENIVRFEERLKKYKKQLNTDGKKIRYPVSDVQSIALKRNYRSTQKLADFCNNALVAKGKKKERLNEEEIKEKITRLHSQKDRTGKIEGIISEEEKKAILEKIQHIVENEDYMIEEEADKTESLGGGRGKEKKPRKIKYGDIAVLSRTRKFGLNLRKRAEDHNIPATYEAGIRLFRTKPGILLLAWLRILANRHSRRGWAVVLEEAGYKLEETEHILDEKDYPTDMKKFREDLEGVRKVPTLARLIFKKYGIHDNYSENIIRVIHESFSSSYMDLSGLVSFVEDRIMDGDTFEVQNLPENTGVEDSLTIQTIHAAKGLEYPVVFVSDLNRHRFPSLKNDYKAIYFDRILGLRKEKTYDPDANYLFDNWKSKVLKKCIPSTDYDEERRLLYVAMTRAEEYLFLTAHKGKESRFFTQLRKKGNLKVTEARSPQLIEEEKKAKQLPPLSVRTPSERPRVKLKATSLIEGGDGSAGRGVELGDAVHEYAREWVKNSNKGTKPPSKPSVDKGKDDIDNLEKFLKNLKGEKFAERPCFLPLLKDEERKVVLSGKIDLMTIDGREVKVIDYKTKKEAKLEKDYRKQLSVYYHAVKRNYETKEESYQITPYIYYTQPDLLKKIRPLKASELKREIKKYL